MNEWERNRRMAEQYRQTHPPGTRIVLLDTSETLQPVPIGMRGTVAFIDDQSQIHMKWDNGRTLAVIPGEDSFRKLTDEEVAEEERAKSMAAFGDDSKIIVPKEPVDCSDLNFFDDMEYECWHLVEKYAELFGVELIQNDEEAPISFDVAKSVQDCIIKHFEDAGVQFKYTDEMEDMAEDNTGPVMGM